MGEWENERMGGWIRGSVLLHLLPHAPTPLPHSSLIPGNEVDGGSFYHGRYLGPFNQGQIQNCVARNESNDPEADIDLNPRQQSSRCYFDHGSGKMVTRAALRCN